MYSKLIEFVSAKVTPLIDRVTPAYGVARLLRSHEIPVPTPKSCHCISLQFTRLNLVEILFPKHLTTYSNIYYVEYNKFEHLPQAIGETMASLLPAERQQRILGILKNEFSVRGAYLSELLGVSEMTIRRDLDELERQGLVERTHGGAVFRQERVAGKFHFQNSAGVHPREKQAIARRAAAMIAPHDTIYIGEGVTASQVVRYVEPGMPFTIFTNNLGVISEIGETATAAELVLLAGTYNAATHALSGPLTMEMIVQVNATKLFLGADGLSLGAGITTPNLEIAVLERSMIQHTLGQVIVLADHTKFGLVAGMKIAPLKSIQVVITSGKIPVDFQKELERLRVDVIIA